MENSKIYFKKCMIKNLKHNLNLLEYGMNIDLLMIWLHTCLKVMVDSFGPVKIMMEMYKVIVLLKVLAL